MRWEDAVAEISRTFWFLLAAAAVGSVIAFQPNSLASYPEAVQQIEALSRIRLTEQQLKSEFLRQRQQYLDTMGSPDNTFYGKFYRFAEANAAMPDYLLHKRSLYRFVVWDSEFDKGMDLSDVPLKKLSDLATWESNTDPSNCFPQMDDDDLVKSFGNLEKFTNGDWQGIYGLVEQPCDELICTLRIYTRQGVFEMKPHLECGNEAIPTLRNVAKTLANGGRNFEANAIYHVLPILGSSKPAEAIRYLATKTEFSYLGVRVSGRWTIIALPLFLLLLTSVFFVQARRLDTFVAPGSDSRLSILLMNDPMTRSIRAIAVLAPACVAAGFYFKTGSIWEFPIVSLSIMTNALLLFKTLQNLNALSDRLETMAVASKNTVAGE